MASELQPKSAAKPRILLDRRGRVYEPTVGPKLRILLVLNFLLFALLAANGAYLATLTGLKWQTGQEYTNWFSLWMLLGHIAVGFVALAGFVIFVGLHLRVALKRPNRKAVRWGFALLISGAVLMGTGVLVVFQRQLFPSTSVTGRLVYWLHVLTPLAVVVCYIAHRLAGPRIAWRYAYGWGVAVAVIVGGLVYMHSLDPRKWYVKGAGEEYFFPSSSRTLGGDGGTPFIPVEAIGENSNQYCLRCHSDAYAGWFHSAHHFSSFNNLAYRQSILDMRRDLDRIAHSVAKEKGMAIDSNEFKAFRAKKLQATRWCAGCHDPVPFFTGAFDDDKFFQDLEVRFPLDGKPFQDTSIQKQPTAHAGLTCVSCHAITNVNSVTGNGDYTIQEPLHYPFAYSENPLLQAINNYLVKAKPDFHKRTFLKPFHRTAEFCQVCHKVSLPEPVNDYKWTRGQDHYDSWHSSGASGFGARSFYHPANAKKCSECHMPLLASEDFGNINGQIHNHLFLGANTALPALRLQFGERHRLPPIGDEDDVIRLQQEFLRDQKVRVDLYGVREDGEIDGRLQVIRPQLPELLPGRSYLLEVVVRNLGVGHEFTQGTADSNEVWLHVSAASSGRVWAESGGIDNYGYVDSQGHFLNSLILDRRGQRIDRRNAKDIFVPLFNHQIPPSSSQVVHYRLTIPAEQREPITMTVKLKYRKFDRIYQDFFMDVRRQPEAAALLSDPLSAGGFAATLGKLAWARVHEAPRGPALPITDLAEDDVTIPVRGGRPVTPVPSPIADWERANDYGVGLLLQGNEGAERGLLKQAEAAFLDVTRLKPDYADGYLNLARVYNKDSRLAEMGTALEAARKIDPNYFKMAWLRAELNRQNGHLAEAIADFRSVLASKFPERGQDFSLDREIRRALAETLFQQAQIEPDGSPAQADLLRQAIAELEDDRVDKHQPHHGQVLAIDPEDREAHYLLDKCYRQLGDSKKADEHLALYNIYAIDNNARDFALRTFRLAHPWANRTSQAVVIYELGQAGKMVISKKDQGTSGSPLAGGDR
jgi:tetratricopeptide (TPR) repeat protein